MKTSPRGVQFIKDWEGLELEAYQDVAGIWTIGYGHTLSAKPGLVWTPEIAEAALVRDLELREDAIVHLVTAPLTQNRFDALVSLVYNIGVSAFRESTVLRRINRGDSDSAIAEAWLWWNKATVKGVLREVAGLTRRRQAEIALFLEPDDRSKFDDVPDNGVVAEPGRAASTPPDADHASLPAASITPPEAVRRPGFFRRLRRFFAPRPVRGLLDDFDFSGGSRET